MRHHNVGLTGLRAAGVAVTALALTASALAAQQAHTCGWDLPPGQVAPESIDQLLLRAGALDDRRAAAVQNLASWVTECDHTAARRASMSLRNEQRRTNSTDPVLRALLAVSLIRGPDVQVLNAEGALLRAINRHTNAEIEGVRLLSAVVRETGWPELVTELAAVAVATGKGESLRVAADALRLAPDSMQNDGLHMALGEVELAAGNLAAAREAASKVKQAHPRALRIIGVATMLDGEARKGGELYLRGLTMAAEPETVQRYFDDLRLLLSQEEREAWAGLEDGQAAWLRRKWEWRAMVAGVDVAERLAEHHRRLVFALQNYRRTSYRGAAPETSVWTTDDGPTNDILDDRGLIFLRHGAPTAQFRMTGGRGRVQRVAWVYGEAGAAQPVFEFDRASDRADYFLAEPAPICGGGIHVVTERKVSPEGGPYPAVGDMMDWASQLAGYDPGLAHYYARCDRGPQYAQINYVPVLSEARRRGTAALNSENAIPRYRNPLAASMNLYAFQAAGRTELVTYLTIDGGRLQAAREQTPSTYALRIMLAAGDPMTENIARRDTVIAFARPEPLPRGAVIGMAVPLTMEPSANARVTLSVLNGYDPDQGQVLATARDFPTFAPATIDISDIVIAEPRNGSWARGTARLAPAPGHALARGSRFRLYYELYNVDPADGLHVSVVITPGRDESILARLRSLVSERNALSVQFKEDAEAGPDGVIRSDREIGGELESGSYVVHVTVRSERTGLTAERQTNLIIVDR